MCCSNRHATLDVYAFLDIGEVEERVNGAEHDHANSPSVSFGKRMRIVVADDVSEIIDAIEQRLSPEYEIVGRAGDGITLISMVRQLQPDVVITDISMPRLSGIQALRQIRSLGLSTPSIVLSVHEDPELAQEALADGVSAFVLKSRLQEDLRPALQEALAGKKFVSERLRRKMKNSPHTN